MIDINEFRAISVFNKLLFCSKVEKIQNGVRIWHPYNVIFDLADPSIGDFMVSMTCLNPWSPDDFIDIDPARIEYATRIDPKFSHEFFSVLSERMSFDGSKGVESTSQTEDNVVSLLDRSRFN